MAARDCALGPFYCSPFLSCDNRMTDRSGDFACFCLLLCLAAFVVSAYKRSGGELSFSSLPSSSPFNHNPTTMSSPTSFPFSFKEDACAQDVVECMEQVGGLF